MVGYVTVKAGELFAAMECQVLRAAARTIMRGAPMKQFALSFSAILILLIFTPPVLSQQLDVKLTSLTSPASAGSNATIAVNTAANAKCQITVHYKSGPSKAQGLFPKSADNQGQVSWTWKVGTNTTPGTWPISVICSSGVLSGMLKTSFAVR
jgi:hypothetical protein